MNYREMEKGANEAIRRMELREKQRFRLFLIASFIIGCLAAEFRVTDWPGWLAATCFIVWCMAWTVFVYMPPDLSDLAVYTPPKKRRRRRKKGHDLRQPGG